MNRRRLSFSTRQNGQMRSTVVSEGQAVEKKKVSGIRRDDKVRLVCTMDRTSKVEALGIRAKPPKAEQNSNNVNIPCQHLTVDSKFIQIFYYKTGNLSTEHLCRHKSAVQCICFSHQHVTQLIAPAS